MKPLKKDHAIDVVIFTVTFQQEFSSESLKNLVAAAEVFRDDYPIINPVNKFEVHLDNKGAVGAGGEFRDFGKMMQSLSENKQRLWELEISKNQIRLSCFVYTRWHEVSPKAFSDLAKAVEIMVDDQNPVVFLSLQYVDRFKGDFEGYSLEQVFNTESKYLSAKALESGELWHLYQGWFDDLEGGDKVLNVLNLSNNRAQSGFYTTLDHASRFHIIPPIGADRVTPEFLQPIFNHLHDNNKQILNDLLNDHQKKAIALNGSD